MNERVEGKHTVLTLWDIIALRHPEITQVFLYDYIPQPHRRPGPVTKGYSLKGHIETFNDLKKTPDNHDSEFFLERFEEALKKAGNRSYISIVTGILGKVGIGKKKTEIWQWYGLTECYETIQDFVPERVKSFLFVDFEIPCSDAAEKIITEVIDKMGIGGWLIKSNGSYHFVGEELTLEDDLPRRYGEFVLAFTGDNPKYQLFRTIGRALINARDKDQIDQVAYYILWMVGHWGVKGEKAFIVDLRHIANSLLTEPILRISPKEENGEPPIVIVKFSGGNNRGGLQF